MSSQGCGFSNGHVWMWELGYKESWVQKNWCFWTVVLEKTLESPLDCKEIQPVHPEGDQSWIFFWRTDAKAETPILWPPDAKSWLIWKDPDAGKDWGQEKGATEDEMVGWHHWFDGHEFGWTPGVGDGQWGLACCSSWSRKESDMTERLNWTGIYVQHWVWIIAQVSSCEAVRISKANLFCKITFLICSCSALKAEIAFWESCKSCWVQLVRASTCSIISVVPREGMNIAAR